jgi:hypothetical protein
MALPSIKFTYIPRFPAARLHRFCEDGCRFLACSSAPRWSSSSRRRARFAAPIAIELKPI